MTIALPKGGFAQKVLLAQKVGILHKKSWELYTCAPKR